VALLIALWLTSGVQGTAQGGPQDAAGLVSALPASPSRDRLAEALPGLVGAPS